MKLYLKDLTGDLSSILVAFVGFMCVLITLRMLSKMIHRGFEVLNHKLNQTMTNEEKAQQDVVILLQAVATETTVIAQVGQELADLKAQTSSSGPSDDLVSKLDDLATRVTTSVGNLQALVPATPAPAPSGDGTALAPAGDGSTAGAGSTAAAGAGQ